MKRWDLVIGAAFLVAAAYDLFRRDWLSFAAYLTLGVALVLGPGRQGPGRIPANVLSVVGAGLFLLKLAVRG